MFLSMILAFQSVELVPNGTMFIHIALILLMIYILNRTFFRPINRVLESRERNKGGHSSEAEEILKSVEEKQVHYDAAMLEARSKGYELIEKERTEAVTKKQAEINSVKQTVAQITANEHEELERQTAEARKMIGEEAEKMAAKISSNILNVN
ncbi:F0F1 ATP synthase subunit B [soil metagenome]